MINENISTINIQQTINYLNYTFSKAVQKLGNKNVKGTKLYKYQTEFCYIINDIQRGPTYMVPKKISEANDLIDEINSIKDR